MSDLPPGAMPDVTLLAEIMESIKVALCECLDDNSPAGAPPSCFVSLGRPPDDCCDYLAVYLDRILPTVDFPNPSTGLDQCGVTQRMARLKVKVVRSCWPVIKPNPTNPFPPASEIQSASEGLLIEATAVWCCLSEILLSGDWHDIVGPGLHGKLEGLEPDRDRGACAGFTATFLIELESCCG